MSISVANTLQVQQTPISSAEKAVAKFAAANPRFKGYLSFADAAMTEALATADSSIGSTSGISVGNASGAASIAPKASDDTSLNSVAETPEQEFMDFMKKSTAEKFEDLWLKQHGLTKEKLAAMSPQDRQRLWIR